MALTLAKCPKCVPCHSPDLYGYTQPWQLVDIARLCLLSSSYLPVFVYYRGNYVGEKPYQQGRPCTACPKKSRCKKKKKLCCKYTLINPLTPVVSCSFPSRCPPPIFDKHIFYSSHVLCYAYKVTFPCKCTPPCMFWPWIPSTHGHLLEHFTIHNHQFGILVYAQFTIFKCKCA